MLRSRYSPMSFTQIEIGCFGGDLLLEVCWRLGQCARVWTTMLLGFNYEMGSLLAAWSIPIWCKWWCGHWTLLTLVLPDCCMIVISICTLHRQCGIFHWSSILSARSRSILLFSLLIAVCSRSWHLRFYQWLVKCLSFEELPFSTWRLHMSHLMQSFSMLVRVYTSSWTASPPSEMNGVYSWGVLPAEGSSISLADSVDREFGVQNIKAERQRMYSRQGCT